MSEEMRGNSILFEREGEDKEGGKVHYLPYIVHIDFLPFFFEIPVYIPIYAYAYMKYMMMKEFDFSFFSLLLLLSLFSFLFLSHRSYEKQKIKTKKTKKKKCEQLSIERNCEKLLFSDFCVLLNRIIACVVVVGSLSSFPYPVLA